MRSGTRPGCCPRSSSRCRCWTRLDAVSSAGVEMAYTAGPAPDNHFTVGPDCSVSESGIGSVSGACRHPSIRAWIISAACVEEIDVIEATPDDHFVASPHRCVPISAIGRVSRARSCPAVRAGIVSSASIQIVGTVVSTPDNHFIAAPDCGVQFPGRGGIGSISKTANCPCPDRMYRRYLRPSNLRLPRPKRSFYYRSRLRSVKTAQ